MNLDHTVETVILQPAPSAAELPALLEAAYQNAHPTDWEMRVRRVLRNFLGDTDPADLSRGELARFTERVFCLVKQTGLKDPAAWIVGYRVRLEAAAKREDETPINEALTCDGLLFSTHFDRNRYINTLVRDRPQWLENNSGYWRRIEDVLQEIASRQPPGQSNVDLGAEPVGPNDQTTSGTQHHDDDKDDVAIVYRSSLNEPTSAPPLAPATGEDGTTKSEATPVDSTMSEAGKIASRAQPDAKPAPSAAAKLGSAADLGDIAPHRKSTEREPVALDISSATIPAALPPRVAFGTTLTDVLSRAKAAIEAGENPRLTAERLACAAEDFDASQRKIGRAIGWSASTVNRVLKWRRLGYPQTSPFGATTRAGRASRRKHNSGSGKGAENLDDDGNVGLIGHRSLPDQSASLPAPRNENLPHESTHTEPLASAALAKRETLAPQTQATPLEDTGRKQRQSSGRQRETQKPPARSPKAGRKPSLESMLVFLDALSECPVLSAAAHKTGIHRKTPAHWIKRSKAGYAGYEIVWRGEQWPFHEHYQSAIDEAHDEVLLSALQVATGVRYKTDPSLVKLGRKGVDAFARDEDGDFIEEATGRPSPKMVRFLLERKLPEKYGKHRKSDIPRTGGVLVVGKRTEQPKSNCAASIKARQWKSLSRKVRGPKA